MTTLTLPEVKAEPRDTSLSAWFTPPKLARQIADWVCLGQDTSSWSLLEPSAGDGALLRAFERYVPRELMWAVDIDERNVQALLGQSFRAERGDFLEIAPVDVFDIVVMNPPYEKSQTELHIQHALRFAPRVVAVVPLTTLEGSARRETLWRHVELTRMAVCSTRPKFGTKAGQTAIAVVDLKRLDTPKPEPLAADGVRIEWWR